MSFHRLIELSQLNEELPTQGPGFFQEAKQYNDSGEFTDEFYDLFMQVTKMKKVMKHPKWLEYMKATDRNFSTMVEGPARDAIKAVTALEKALSDVDNQLDKVNGNGSDEDIDDQPLNSDDEPQMKDDDEDQ